MRVGMRVQEQTAVVTAPSRILPVTRSRVITVGDSASVCGLRLARVDAPDISQVAESAADQEEDADEAEAEKQCEKRAAADIEDKRAAAFHPPLETATEGVGLQTVGDREIAIAHGARAMSAQPESVSRTLQSTKPLALLCDDIATETRPTELETTLEHADTLAAALPSGCVTTVLTGAESAGYDELWHLEAETGAVQRVDHDPAGTPREHRRYTG